MSDDLSIPNPSYRSNRAGRYNPSASRRRPGMDADTKRLLMFAGGVGGILVLLIAASALTGHHSGQIPIVAADPNPIRIKPENPGGMKIDAAENDVFSGGTDTANARLAPAAEEPDPSALRAAEAAGARPATARAAAVVGTPAVPPPAAAAEGARAPALVGASLPSPPPPIPLEERQASPPPASPVRTTERLAIAAPPAALPHDAAAGSKLGVAAHAPLADEKPTAGHYVMVQLAAVDSDAAAKEEWERLRGRYHDLLEGRQLAISRAEWNGHTYWRVRTSGFADVTQARAFCDRIHAKGGGCSIVQF